MPDVEEVHVTGPATSHWVVAGPFGKTVEWDAEITEDISNRRIAWRTVGDADVDSPPAGKAGELVAESFRKVVQAGGLGAA